MTDALKKKKAADRLGFAARLKQHHMFPVASVYATVAWVMILVANQVFPDIGLTRDDVRYLIGAVALGFPLVLTFGWMFIPPSRENPEQFTRWKRVRFRLGAAVSLLVIALVTLSGVYLWRLNATHGLAPAAGPTAVAVLPFDHLGSVDALVSVGTQDAIERTLAELGTVRIIAHDAISGNAIAGRSPIELARAAGAAYVIQGSIQRPDPKAPYTVRADLVSVADTTPVFSDTDTFAPAAPPVDIEQEVASEMAGPVRFLSRPDDWLAAGFKTTSNPRAMSLLRQALMAYYYNGDSSRTTLLREALDLDPDFAQAHAYLAIFILYDDTGGNARLAADAEVAKANVLAPGLPEARLAHGVIAFFSGDNPTAARELAAVEAAFPRNFLFHYIIGRELHYEERDEEALKEIEAAAAIDPIQPDTTAYAARIEYFNRNYDTADRLLAADQAAWPLHAGNRLYRAQVAFAHYGDVPTLAKVVDGDWSAYMPDGDWLPARQIEVAHLQGEHTKVLKLLADYPHDLLESTRFWDILGRSLYRDSLALECLRLLGRDREATAQAALDLPSALDAMQHLRGEPQLDRLHVALIQAFGGDTASALKTVEPIIEGFRRPESQWGIGEARYLADTAVVLAWSGEKQQAISFLDKALSARGRAHAAILAHDPVWRPLYQEPAFVKLLADHGQKLAYAK